MFDFTCVIISGSIHNAGNGIISFFFMALFLCVCVCVCVCVYGTYSLSIHLSMDIHIAFMSWLL